MLDPHDKAILDLETRHYRWPAVKEAAVRRELGLNYSAYYLRLHWLLDQPDALAYAPITVKRLVRLRDQRRAVRTR